jgi:hypothetical protein
MYVSIHVCYLMFLHEMHPLNLNFFQKRSTEKIPSVSLFPVKVGTMAAITTNYEFPDLLEDRAVPTSRAASSRPPHSINLSSTVDKQTTNKTDAPEDVSLSDLLDDDFSAVQSREEVAVFKENSSRSDGTSETTGSESVPDGTIGMEEFLKYEQDEEDYEDSASDDSSESSFRSYCSENTSNILEKAHDRLALQNLKEEIKALEATVEKKDDEIEQLSGQLRRAVSTKCDLVLSHSELERFHESTLKKRDSDMVLVQRANYSLLEMRANIEKEFMNELAKVTDAMEEEKNRHREEMDDWERMHRNEMLEKEFKIAGLAEEVRKAKAASGQSPSSNKKKTFAGMFKHTP